MRIAACQLPDVRDDVPHSLELIQTMACRADEAAADVVLFPECFLQGYFVDDRRTPELAIDLESDGFRRILRKLEHLRPMLVLGLIEQSGGRCFNTAAVIHQGEVLGRYRKRYLLRGEQAVFAHGADTPVFTVGHERFGIAICYDLRFAEAYEAPRNRGADVLLAPCNNMLKHDNALTWQHRHNEIRCERAGDAGIALVSSDVTGRREGRLALGPTAVIDRNGQVVRELHRHKPDILVADVPAAKTL